MLDWRDTQLAELIEIKHGFAFKGEFFSDSPSHDILVTPGNFAVGGGFQLNKPKFYTGPVPEDYVLNAGDVIVTMTDLSKEADTLGYSAIVPASKERFLHNQRIGKVIPKSEEVFLPFVAWVMRTIPYRNEIVGGATGSTVKHTSPSRILSHKFKLPAPLEQRAIASVLSALDDKIELNRQMNKTLEAMARAIFKDWFVDFGPTRAKMEGRAPYLAPDIWSLFPDRLDDEGKPEGWDSVCLGDLAEQIAMGPFGSNIKVETFVANGVPIISGGHLRGMRLDDTSYNFVSAEHADRLGRSNVKRGDVVFTHAGNIGQVAIISDTSRYDRYVLSQRQFYMRCNRDLISPMYVVHFFHTTEGQHALLANASQVGVPSIARPATYLRSIKINRPPKTLLSAFDENAGSLHLKAGLNLKENCTLVTTRDFLLPKLMAGKVRVKDAEKLVGEAT
ncbi:restriction endonuclease subunit S [Rhizobium ruizarguesonis]|uniref:restriction endonuclease subunit S n=1 Tax=Rhizobium ruizarguesonis TaxID=2081791 RepID=UPI001FDEBE1E|nr:restriction endonuclease subunit S [Rhizobium ruizarguesonis]